MEAEQRAQITHLNRPSKHAWYAPQRTKSRVQQELSEQVDSAVAFADFCTFLTAGKTDVRAARLVSAAQALYDQTVEDLSRGGPER